MHRTSCYRSPTCYGVQKDYAPAIQWYTKAAAQGFAISENNLGYDYLHGRGVPVDYPKAFQWLSSAARQGNSDAEENVGYMYVNGLGTPVNLAAGVQWYLAAAKRDNVHAQLYLAECYSWRHCGVTPNPTTSQIYFAEAADHKARNSNEYDQEVRDIIYSHRQYPQAALDAHRSGVVVIRFDCPDRKPEDVTITQSSGDPALDDTARQAIMGSYLPARPPQWRGRYPSSTSTWSSKPLCLTPRPHRSLRHRPLRPRRTHLLLRRTDGLR